MDTDLWINGLDRSECGMNTEGIITRTAYEMIGEITSSIYETSDNDRNIILGEIAGIMELANALKEELKK